ncbi:glyceraldehyde 3-phosphate dehydrogenase NAD-binding domain-containing protein [Thauera sp.]|uniref:type I glyceraldehyde-3-phosphate dehydrogenase n=1 Tax=Thauera sp. TaxID=1905334 RepID=UPI002C62D902|nr:glyceraldehyde 3-phosphate dehydrogenase NAD-binding domain-containing protein [Thauera sp.]HRP25288.1 glyceraldehyde 3-phosphate dehydrogenase NAD-binding domain-containing protein [Thauera sp.]
MSATAPALSTATPGFRIAINGYGRIGRCYLRALHEAGLSEQFRVVAINEPADLASIAYLTRFDSTHGRFPGTVDSTEDTLLVDGRAILVTHARSPETVDWGALELDLVVECSGQYGSRADLQRFLDAGCPRLLLSHPGNGAEDVDATIVYGINHHELRGSEGLVSNASCTTNAVVPVLDLLQREIGIERVLLTTLHSAMNDQPLIDGYHHTDLRRTRSAMQSIIPVSTGLARGVERLLPALAGRVQAKAIRVPTHNVSAIDMVLTLTRDVTAGDINHLLRSAAQGCYARLIAYSDEAHASIDFNHDPHSAIVDGGQTRAIGPRMVNLMIWFDNEWGFASRMADVTRHWLAGGHPNPAAPDTN